MEIYVDRFSAGQRLAEALKKYNLADAIVVGLPRGGMPVAASLAKELGLELDTIIIKKIGVPWQPELAVGAICEGEDPVFNEDLLKNLGLTKSEISLEVEKKRAEVEESKKRLGRKKAPDISGRDIVLVDDGIATGATVRMAVKALKNMGARTLTLAVPVASQEAYDKLRFEVDKFVCPNVTANFQAVGQWYKDFTQVSDEEVIDLLRSKQKSEKYLMSQMCL